MRENSLCEKLFDAILEIATEEAFRQEMEEMPSCEELNEQYKPSPELDRKIRKMIAQYNRKRAIQKMIPWL